MKYTQEGNVYVLKIERGEEVVETLIEFCKTEGIENATIKAIGAVDWISCGYYALPEKQYHFKKYEGSFEVLTATGNVAPKEGVPFVHLHAVFSDEENTAFGGHVEAMRVGVVLEVIVQKLGTKITRELDQNIGLFLMTCGT